MSWVVEETNPKCENLTNKFDALTAGVNMYDIFGVCYPANGTDGHYSSKDVGF